MIFQTSPIIIAYYLTITSFPFFYFSLSFLWASFTYYDTHQRNSFKKLKTEVTNFVILKFKEALSRFGVFWGIIISIAGLLGLIVNVIPKNFDISPDLFVITTSIILIISGILTIVKPIRELPTLTLVGLITSSISSIFILLFIPDSIVPLINGISPKDILLGFSLGFLLFIIIIGVFYTHKLTAIAKALSWPPISAIVSLLTVLIGILVLIFFFF